MTSPRPAPPPLSQSRRARDLLALIGICLGAFLVTGAAAAADLRAGFAVLGLFLLAAGVAAGIDRTPER